MLFPINSAPISSKKEIFKNREKFNILSTLITGTQLHKYLIQRPPVPSFFLLILRGQKRRSRNYNWILHSHEDRIPFVKICISKSWGNEGIYPSIPFHLVAIQTKKRDDLYSLHAARGARFLERPARKIAEENHKLTPDGCE